MTNEPQINGTKLHTVGKYQVWQTIDNNYIVTGGAYPMLFETMPTANELTFDKICVPRCLLDNYDKFQLEAKGNLLVSKHRLLNDLSDYEQRWQEQQILLQELEYETY